MTTTKLFNLKLALKALKPLASTRNSQPTLMLVRLVDWDATTIRAMAADGTILGRISLPAFVDAPLEMFLHSYELDYLTGGGTQRPVIDMDIELKPNSDKFGVTFPDVDAIFPDNEKLLYTIPLPPYLDIVLEGFIRTQNAIAKAEKQNKPRELMQIQLTDDGLIFTLCNVYITDNVPELSYLFPLHVPTDFPKIFLSIHNFRKITKAMALYPDQKFFMSLYKAKNLGQYNLPIHIHNEDRTIEFLIMPMFAGGTK